MKVVIALLIVAVAAGCSSAHCELDPGDDPVAVRRLGCASDREVMSTGRDDAVFAHTRTILWIVDREDGNQVYFVDPDKYTLHYYFARDFLDDPGRTPVGTLAEFNILNYRRPNRRFLCPFALCPFALYASPYRVRCTLSPTALPCRGHSIKPCTAQVSFSQPSSSPRAAATPKMLDPTPATPRRAADPRPSCHPT